MYNRPLPSWRSQRLQDGIVAVEGGVFSGVVVEALGSAVEHCGRSVQRGGGTGDAMDGTLSGCGRRVNTQRRKEG